MRRVRQDNDGDEAHDEIQVYFSPRDSLAERVCQHISRATGGVLACTAWITDDRVLHALATTAPCVSLIVQNDDFAARGTRRGAFASAAQYNRWAQRLAEQWSALSGTHAAADHGLAAWLRREYPTLASVRSGQRITAKERAWAAAQSDVTSATAVARTRWVVDAVRAHGERSTTRNAHVARMHHKFFVVFRNATPFGVWTGSYNPTRVAAQSAENAVWIEDERIATLYAHEHVRLLLASQPVRWTDRHRAPIWGCAHASYTVA